MHPFILRTLRKSGVFIETEKLLHIHTNTHTHTHIYIHKCKQPKISKVILNKKQKILHTLTS